ncbi:MAG: hypothetical protein Q6J78_05115, partial [Thermostichales cyanobacterium SRBZ-1_bins_19]
MRSWIWSVVHALVAFLNDRLLPQAWHLDAEGIADGWQRAWENLRTYVTEQPDAPKRYRGVIIDETAAPNRPAPVMTETVYYRGCPIQRTATGKVAVDVSAPAYVPPYQRWFETRVRTWLINLGLGNRDLTDPTPALEKVYR